MSTLSQREHQKNWYDCHKEKVREQKRIWYLQNRDRIREKEKENREYKKQLRMEKKLIEERKAKEVKKSLTCGMSYFEILDVLRKDVKCHLWNRSITRWTESDWSRFNQLKAM